VSLRAPIVIAVAFLVVRLIYPVLLMPAAGLGDSEELLRGALPHDLLHGLKLPFWEYLADDYSGGSIVVGLLAVPAFALFGPSLFALRLVAILFALGVLLVWYALVARHFGRRAAAFTSVFFVLPPAIYLEGSSMTMGFHTESMLFSAVGFWLLFELLHRGDAPLRWPAALGLVLGFGSWFCYTTLASVAIVLVWWLWCARRRRAARALVVFAACFALGASPWLLVNVQQSFGGLELLDAGLRYDWIRGLPETGQRIVAIALWYLPTLLVVDPTSESPALVWSVVYSTLFGGALLYQVWRDHRATTVLAAPSPRMFFVTASVVYVGAVAATRYEITPYGSLYLAPMLPFLFGAAGLALSDLWDHGRWGRVGAAGLVALSALGGGLSLGNLVDREWPGASFTMPGYSHPQLGSAFYLRHRYEYDRVGRLLRRLEDTMTEADRAELLRYPAIDDLGPLTFERFVVTARHFAERSEPARSIASFRLGVALQSLPDAAVDTMLTRLSSEHPPELASWISDGARLARLGRRLQVGALPPLHRLPLTLTSDVQLFFLDQDTYPALPGAEPAQVGWVAGGVQAQFLLEGTRSIGAIRVELTNGDRPNVVELASPGRSRSIGLVAGQRAVEVVELGPGVRLEGKRFWTLAIRSRGGHFPILTRGERDARYLGVHVGIRPVP
jgi:4-amino-4-deoxy-L-arabinose transferase-like glycosyltransferase